MSTVAGSVAASVTRTTSIVASDGASMPAPFAIPQTDQPSPWNVAVLAWVSVVMIAAAASSWPSVASAAAAVVMPALILSIGSSSPMSPVEQTATSAADSPRVSATSSAVRCVSWNPWCPVHALAPPELRTTASTRPSATT